MHTLTFHQKDHHDKSLFGYCIFTIELTSFFFTNIQLLPFTMFFTQHNIIFLAQGLTIGVTVIHITIIVLCDILWLQVSRLHIDTEICFVAASDNKKDFFISVYHNAEQTKLYQKTLIDTQDRTLENLYLHFVKCLEASFFFLCCWLLIKNEKWIKKNKKLD